MKLSSYSEDMKLLEKYLMNHFVERLGEIKVYDIVFVAFQYTLDHFINVL